MEENACFCYLQATCDDNLNSKNKEKNIKFLDIIYLVWTSILISVMGNNSQQAKSRANKKVHTQKYRQSET